MKRYVVLFLALLLIGLPPLSAHADEEQPNDFALVLPMQSSIVINGDNLVVGDIVVVGIPKADGDCEFGSIKVRTTAPEYDRTRWLGIVFDAKQCRAVVNAKWEGALEEGPQQLVKPLTSLLSTSMPIQETFPHNLEHERTSPYGVMATKTGEQHVFMYGYGGTWDKLTHKYGRITFSYNGQSATISSQSGSC